MRGLTVVIPSKTATNLLACIEAMRLRGEHGRVILVDDFDDPYERAHARNCAPQWRYPVAFIIGKKPFCFARNVNLGIVASGDDDVVVLNDDALLKTIGGFAALQRAAEEHPEFGIISSTTNVAGNPSQKPMGIGLRTEPKTVAFVCVLIPRRTIQQVGLMDERFGGLTPEGRVIYGWCDNDYSRRVREAGLKIGIHDDCFVDHGSLRSSFRGHPHAAGDISEGQKLYLQKWGDLN